MNDYSLAYLTLILSLHYLVKCRRRSLAIYATTMNSYTVAHASAQKIIETTKSLKIC